MLKNVKIFKLFSMVNFIYYMLNWTQASTNLHHRVRRRGHVEQLQLQKQSDNNHGSSRR
jgi:hypothetical protein